MSQSVPLETERLTLAPFDTNRHLTTRYVAWLSDPDVVRYSEQRHHHHTLESCRRFAESFKDGPGCLWAIERKQDGLHIGNIHADIDPRNSLADVAILIGDRTVWGQGYGLEAWNAVLGWLLGDAGIRKVVAGCMRDNAAMRAIMKASGMADDGVRSDQYLLDGKPQDVVFAARFRTD
ncbi:MAG: GNAT family N-acetyltransferase [Rhodospirillales bacterium]